VVWELSVTVDRRCDDGRTHGSEEGIAPIHAVMHDHALIVSRDTSATGTIRDVWAEIVKREHVGKDDHRHDSYAASPRLLGYRLHRRECITAFPTTLRELSDMVKVLEDWEAQQEKIAV
jgi:hypothetical protein